MRAIGVDAGIAFALHAARGDCPRVEWQVQDHRLTVRYRADPIVTQNRPSHGTRQGAC